ncbi:hypothetical protein [Olivibacter sitiensis]|uniref:hypothetical protein n=1 Tax=Olivibacter sitiensis TaxID=376470 RepID=UPI00146FC704|nr:hypothetical protein [Olivibacter sitiensis]
MKKELHQLSLSSLLKTALLALGLLFSFDKEAKARQLYTSCIPWFSKLICFFGQFRFSISCTFQQEELNLDLKVYVHALSDNHIISIKTRRVLGIFSKLGHCFLEFKSSLSI